MTLLVLGLALFLGVHSLRIVADRQRTQMIAKLGSGPWKGLFSLISVAGLALIVVGYGQARDGAPLLSADSNARHVGYALTWLGFVAVTAAYWPRNHIKQIVGHPMVVGVGLWALAHLLVKTTPAALTLFGAFLIWALIDYFSLRAREKTASAETGARSILQTFLTFAAGSAVWAVFAFFLHQWLFGVSPIPLAYTPI